MAPPSHGEFFLLRLSQWELPFFFKPPGTVEPITTPPKELRPRELNGSHELRNHGTKEFRKQFIVVDGGTAAVAIGFGLSNMVMLKYPSGIVVIDSLDGRLSMEEALGRASFWMEDLPILTIILTHNHGDHVMGTEALIEYQRKLSHDDPPILAHERTLASLRLYNDPVAGGRFHRASKQFGLTLSDDERINCGIGPSFRYQTLKPDRLVMPTHEWTGEKKDLTFDDEILHLLLAPGESKDQVIVWRPSRMHLHGSDNIYKAFPNIYALRGETRDPIVWIKSLKVMADLRPSLLTLGHSRPIESEYLIQEILQAYSDAIQYVYDQTIRLINSGGKEPDEIAVEVCELPESLRHHPYLQPWYGSIAWSVKAIINDHFGWFSGRPEDLTIVSAATRSKKLSDLVGGTVKLLSEARKAVDDGDLPWALELISHAHRVEPSNNEFRDYRYAVMRLLADETSTSNMRQWLLSCTKPDPTITAQMRKRSISQLPDAATVFQLFPTRFDASRCEDQAIDFSLTTSGKHFCLHARNSVLHVAHHQCTDIGVSSSAHGEVDDATWLSIISGEMSLVRAAWVMKCTNCIKLQAFFRCLDTA